MSSSGALLSSESHISLFSWGLYSLGWSLNTHESLKCIGSTPLKHQRKYHVNPVVYTKHWMCRTGPHLPRHQLHRQHCACAGGAGTDKTGKLGTAGRLDLHLPVPSHPPAPELATASWQSLTPQLYNPHAAPVTSPNAGRIDVHLPVSGNPPAAELATAPWQSPTPQLHHTQLQ